MSIAYFDRVKVGVSGTPGTGAITLGSAVAGFQSFSTAGVTNGASVSYVIEDGAAWEVGHGTYTSSGTSLSRDAVLGSSAAGSKIAASSSATVYLTLLSADLAALILALGSSGPVATDVGALGAHKGWRVHVTGTIGSVGQVALGTMELHKTVGGPDMIFGGSGVTTFATGGAYSGHETAKLFDGDPATYYISTETTNAAYFGAMFATPTTASELKLIFHNAGEGYDGPPSAYQVEYSDDTTTGTDGTWTSATGWSETAITSWADGTAHVTTPPAVSVTSGHDPAHLAHSYWRVQTLTTDSNDGVHSLAELKFFDTPDMATNLATGGTALASPVDGHPAANAFDGNVGTYYGNDSATTFPNAYIGYHFPSPTKVIAVGINSVSDNYWYPRTPKNFNVQWSDDGVTWTTAWEVTQGTPWGFNAYRSFVNSNPDLGGSGPTVNTYEMGPATPIAASHLTPDAGVTLTDVDGRGLSMSVVYSGTSGAQYKAVKDKPSSTAWTVTGRLRASGLYYSFPSAGLIVYDSTNSKGIWIGKNGNATNSDPGHMPSINVQRTTSGLTYNNTANTEPVGEDTPWFRIATDGTNIHFLASADGIIWTEIFSEGLTTYTAALDKVGLYFSTPGATNGTSGVAVTRNMGLLCTYYKEEAIMNLTGMAT